MIVLVLIGDVFAVVVETGGEGGVGRSWINGIALRRQTRVVALELEGMWIGIVKVEAIVDLVAVEEETKGNGKSMK